MSFFSSSFATTTIMGQGFSVSLGGLTFSDLLITYSRVDSPVSELIHLITSLHLKKSKFASYANYSCITFEFTDMSTLK